MKQSTAPQHPPVHVGCTHQSMPIVMTLSPELRVPVPTVGGIHLIIFKQVGIKKITSIVTVMEHNSSWLISTLDKSSTPVATILCVECWSWCTTAVHIPHKSLLDYHHTALLQWQCPRPSQTEILCCTRWFWCLECSNCRQSIWRSCFSPTRWRASRSQEYPYQCQLQHKENTNVQIQ